MARTPKWELPAMAKGDPSPMWPLPEVPPKFATWSFGGGRPFGCKEAACERWHAGIDLTGAPDRAVVVAPEDGVVKNVDRGWSGAAKAVDLVTSSGLFIVLGGFSKNSPAEFGVKAGTMVERGTKLGRVLGSYGMVHLETYKAEPNRTRNSVWKKGSSPPAGLLNPTNYVELAAGRRPSLLRSAQRHQALAALGFYEGSLRAPWGGPSKAALLAAQSSLGIVADGVWGPSTEAALLAALEARAEESAHPSAAPPASPHGLWIGVGFGVLGLAGALSWYARKLSTESYDEVAGGDVDDAAGVHL